MSKINKHYLAALLKSSQDLDLQFEYRFSKRLFRFDCAIVEHKIAIEFEGGIFTNGRHTRGTGYLKDMEKYNLATVNGWRVLRYAHVKFTYNQILEDVKNILKTDSEKFAN